MSDALGQLIPAGPVVEETAAVEHGMTRQEYARVCEILGRKPVITELGMYSVMWSEHCSYKSSKVHLRTLPTAGPAVVQGPGENAGAVDLGNGLAAVFKVESHNHPSYIEPYQGAATGVGGILRDIFTMGARPLALLDALRFGDLERAKNRWLLDGVVGGIAGYGNCMGIPTVGGEVYFDSSYDHNPLVNVMAFGLVQSDRIVKSRADGPGNPVVYFGARTGRDGIYGVSLLASATFDEGAEEKRPAVQVGDPFTEKKLMEASLELVNEGLLVGMQDMGGAGLSCCTAEMSSNSRTGMEVWVDRVPRRETGMTPYEVMLSESQERMLLVCTPDKLPAVMAVLDKWDLDAVVIGKVIAEPVVRVIDAGTLVAEMPARSLAEEGPVYERPFVLPESLPPLAPADVPCSVPVADVLGRLLQDPSIASKRWIFQQYDQTVRFNTVQRPGGEAAVIWLKEYGSDAGVAMAIDCNPWFAGLDPAQGARLAVAEACRNVACTGARPLGITNNLNFGSPEKTDRMGQFAAAVAGMSEACMALGVPVTGGNVSFYNETDGRPILPTPTVGALGKIERASESVRSGFQVAGDTVVMLGAVKVADAGLGGSAYVRLFHAGRRGAPPTLDLDLERRLQELLVAAAERRLLRSAKDCSDGGLAVALAEACFAAADGDRTDADQARAGRSAITGLLGAEIEIGAVAADAAHASLFGEAASRVIASVDPAALGQLEGLAAQHRVPLRVLGAVTRQERPVLRVTGDGREWLAEPVVALYANWAGALAAAMEQV